MNNNLISLLHKLPALAIRRSPLKGGRCSFCNAKTKNVKLFRTKLKLVGFIFTKIGRMMHLEMLMHSAGLDDESQQ